MKNHIKNLFTRLGAASSTALILPVLIAALNLVPAGRVTAQTFTTLYGFTALRIVDNGNFTFNFTNSDGAHPYAGLITNSSGNTLYGTASQGGSSGRGTVFAVNTDGTGFTNLHSFTAVPAYPGPYTNRDGTSPNAGLILSGNTLYGTAAGGGSGGEGTVFAVNTDGTGFTNLYSFTAVPAYPGAYTNSDGANPHAGLILSGNTLYGTAIQGGSSGNGTLFAVNTDGTGFTNLYSFTALSDSYPYTNSDGASSRAGLILSGNTLYGTTYFGGSSGNGTVFAINTDGTGITNLHSFAGFPSDGAYPNAGLILSGNTLYGTAYVGGNGGSGTVFAINTDGTGITNLHSFAAGVSINFGSSFTNSEGAFPETGLILSGDTLYGTAHSGGSSGAGTVFAVNTNGTAFTNLYTFTPLNFDSSNVLGSSTNSDGASPQAGLVLSGNTLYGTAALGGSGGVGTVFSLSFRPQLTITPSGTNVILSWPSNVAGFDYTGYILQSAPTLTGTFTNLPGATSPYTHPITGAQQFFRLNQ